MNCFKQVKLRYALRHCKANAIKSAALKGGVKEAFCLAERLNKILPEEMYTLLHFYPMPEAAKWPLAKFYGAFYAGTTSLDNVRLKVQQSIVHWLGFENTFRLFKETSRVVALFNSYPPHDRNRMSTGLYLYYGEHRDDWESMPGRIGTLLVRGISEAKVPQNASPELLTFLADNFGLVWALRKSASCEPAHRWNCLRGIMPHVSEEGFKTFLTRHMLGDLFHPLQEWLFWNKPEWLPIAVGDCEDRCDPRIEGYLLELGTLPEKHVSAYFVYPQNFSAAMTKLGVEKMHGLLPEVWPENLSSVADWVRFYNRPDSIAFADNLSPEAKKYLFADDKLCQSYIRSGKVLSANDIKALLTAGKYKQVALYRRIHDK